MKLGFIKNRKHIIMVYIAIMLAVLGSSEPFDSIAVSPWVMIVGLGLLLAYYFIFRVIKLSYISKFDMIMAFCNILFWIALLYLSDWSNITGWDRLIYVIYPYMAGIFFVCLLAMNLVIFIIKWVRGKKMQI